MTWVRFEVPPQDWVVWLIAHAVGVPVGVMVGVVLASVGVL